jgi:hypothetical protein
MRCLTHFIFLILFFSSFFAFSQNLTIDNNGQTGTSGTNWSITGNTLNVGASGSAAVHPDVISNHLNSVGDLTVNLPGETGVIRQCIIDGSITYTGSATRTLTFFIANDILFENAGNSISATNGALNVVLRAANFNATPDDGRVSIRNTNSINTNGGHLWIGGGGYGGNVTWNGLAVGGEFARTWRNDVPGLWIENATITTNGGNIYLAGRSHNTSSSGGTNYGINIENSTISSQTGTIDVVGDLKGMYLNGIATRIISSTGTNSITSTTGAITILGTGSDQAPNDNGWRNAIYLGSNSTTTSNTVSSTSGNITIQGDANFSATVNDKEGVILAGTGLKIVSQTGDIAVKGSNSLETSGQYSNSIRFSAGNVANAIRIGYDGTNAYSGNILIEGNSIYQRIQNSGAGSIAIQTTGNLTVQSKNGAFTYMRAGDAGTLTYDDDWNFGANLGSFTFGKTTNNQAITFSNDITINGPFTAYGGNIGLAGIAANGNVYVRSTTYIDQNGAKTTSTNGGDLIYWSGGSGESYIRPGTITTNGGNVFMGGDYDAVGTRTWHGHTVGGGYAVSQSFDGIALRGNIDTRETSNTSIGGDVLIAGESGNSNAADLGAEGANRTIATGDGDIILMPFSEQLQQIGGSLRMNLETTGKVSIAPVSGNSFWGGQNPQLTYNGSLSSGTFTGSSALAGVQIPNIANLGGLELGTYSGSGVVGDSPYLDANVKNMQLTTGFTVAGPINVKGDELWVQGNLETTAAGALIRLKSDGPGTGNDEGWISLAADLTTNGGDIILWANAANRTSGQANNEIWFSDNRTLTSNGGRIVLAGGLDDGSNGGTANDGIPDGYRIPGRKPRCNHTAC